MTIPLETERLIFRDWTAADLEPFHALCSDPGVMQFVGDGEPWSWERTEQFVARAREMSQTLGFCQWPVIHKAESGLIGFCGFVPASDGVEIGWRLAKEFWGRGLATEAARAVLKHGFESLGFQRVIATVQSPNLASIRVIEKLGLKPESRFHRNGREVILFSINNDNDRLAKSDVADTLAHSNSNLIGNS
ncbi:MAG: GNAT family N-acetyltransferase [Planctomycetaceae bacterium]|nr:GNAT family N-acetyltransferase [Planctomycetaceae bacterium]